jgi:hypothetical protein
VTTRTARHNLVLADDGIIDLLAVEIAARGTRTVALTRAERQLAAAKILAQGGTAYLVSKRLRVSGTTALKLAARCQDVITELAGEAATA